MNTAQYTFECEMDDIHSIKGEIRLKISFFFLMWCAVLHFYHWLNLIKNFNELQQFFDAFFMQNITPVQLS